MAGNSQRKGATRRPGSKKGPVAGTGGQPRRGLQGKGPTPRATERPHHPAAKRENAAAKREPVKRVGVKRDGVQRDGVQRDGVKRDGAPRTGTRAASSTSSASTRRSAGTSEMVGGRNPVVEALRAGVPAKALYVASRIESDDRIREALKLAADRGLPLLEASKIDLDRMTNNGVHQGLVLQVPAYRYAHPQDLLDAAAKSGRPALLVALDGVTDPRNLGAVVRSAAAFGGHGVIVPERRAAGMTASAWKVSAGAAARVPVARATNLNRTLLELKKAGCFIVGLDAGGSVALPDLTVATDPVVLVAGSEGKGLSRLIRQNCDVIASIPMIGGIESLNAGVAAGVALYEIARRRAGAG